MFNVLNAIQISDDKWPTPGTPKSDSMLSRTLSAGNRGHGRYKPSSLGDCLTACFAARQTLYCSTISPS
jgi:hypothetical protein